ncbi:TRAFAC clade GTPase domain-containing protein [Ideonella sp.]|uniref:TRAFAC clade GTPase domain-containing protein n=1 Tax=Ideonella sp. TaxID=1929293 RepID=UPI003BB642F3
MTNKAIVVLGLPASGKTTYLAALWHLLQARKIESKIKSVRLRAGEAQHLNEIAKRWLAAKKQERTSQDRNRTVTMEVQSSASGNEFVLSFPDVAGEAFAEIWEKRECDPEVLNSLGAQGVLLFIHATDINPPNWIADDAKLNKLLGIQQNSGEPVAWEPRFAPTQVQLVDLLRCLQEPPLGVGPRRLAVALSAWDLAEGDKRNPEKYLALHLPLFHQYLNHGLDPAWVVKVYGVSAQGAEYDSDGGDGKASAGAKTMREMEVPSERIKVVHGESSSHDLTEPLFWLLD